MGKSVVTQRNRDSSSNSSGSSGIRGSKLPPSSDVPKNMPPNNDIKAVKVDTPQSQAQQSPQIQQSAQQHLQQLQDQPKQTGVGQVLPNINSRKSSTNSNFLFNAPRNDSLNSIVNNYSSDPKNDYANVSGGKSLSVDSNFASFYRKDSTANPSQVGGSNTNGFENSSRPRGDSIYLPPPINSQIRNDYEQSEQSSQDQPQGLPPGVVPGSGAAGGPVGIPSQHPQLNSRANSIFNSIIQFPNSNQNSISGPSGGNPSKSNSISNNIFSAGGNLSSKSRLPSLTGGEFNFNPQDFEFLSKENPGGSISWQQQQLQQQQLQMLLQPQQQQQQSGGSLSKSKRGSIDSGLWDHGVFESIAGLPLSSESVSNILAGISNGSIQLSGSNNERRDSLLKYLNDSNYPIQQQQQPPRQQSLKGLGRQDKKGGVYTKLREDIFDKPSIGNQIYNQNQIPQYGANISQQLQQQPGQQHQLHPQQQQQHQQMLHQQQGSQNIKKRISEGSIDPVSPSNSSLSSKTSGKRYDEPQSPKTSPSGFHVKMKSIDKQQQHPAVRGQYGGYISGGNYQVSSNGPAQSHQSAQQVSPTLVPAQQFVQAEDGRPLLGATKIDQLMLVIQARDNGISTAIPQGADGSILANPETVIEQSRMQRPVAGIIPQPIGLVGGIDKPGRVHRLSEEADSNDDVGSGTAGHMNKRRSKDHQCKYCFKYFTQATHLDVHIRSHIGLKPFECSYCHKKFTQGGNLRTHLRLHTGEKPFTCESCNRSFSRKGNLAAHLLTHKNEKPFECRLDGCDKAFTQLGNLKSHQNRFHLEALNSLTHKLAELTGDQLNNLPPDEKDLLEYFKDLYKNSNKGIRGRGKKSNQLGWSDQEESQHSSPQLQRLPPPQMQHQLPPQQLQPQYGYDVGYKTK
ncbi:hypothetical protein CLIB1423_35S00760 [[Candida] railenensis]|uniref:C2H2-type domain-containing protein n=1 Tax=[Candida] railenensis TaxID=45579 RepID=A0A9P0QVN9_9ASCO|nr:hypothetical protein CLIB1423_35S00760 [[Candida] railenensis]